MTIDSDLVTRYETEHVVDWFEALVIYHSEFSPAGDEASDTFYIHNAPLENGLTRIVDGAPHSFYAIPFEVTLPTRDGEGRGDLIINFSFPQTQISELLGQALDNPLEPVSVRYSAFLYTAIAPALYDPWLQFYMTEVSANESTVTAVCRISDMVNRRFPTGVYSGQHFPGLIRR